MQWYMDESGVAPAKVDPDVLLHAIADADVVHVMLPFSLGKAAGLYCAEHGIPLTAGFHCQAENLTSHFFMKDFAPANRETYRILYDRLYCRCDCIHFPTQFICDTFESVVGPVPHRVISNGVAKAFTPGPSRVPKEEGTFTVLFTGRYSPEKSHDVLIDAVAQSAYKDRIRLVLAGAGPREGEIRRRAEKCGIHEPVMKFFGREELIDVIRFADLYVHPAEIEIEAISCLEAIACGKVPLIADSPKSATRYFALTEDNLFRMNDPADLARKLDHWLSHPDERAACAEKYLGYAKQFAFDACMDAMEQMLIGTARKKRGSSPTISEPEKLP